MTYKIFIDGEAGTTGLEIKKRLFKRQDISILSIDENRRKDVSERLRKFKEADIVFLCLPDEQAREIVEVAHTNTRIIDASTAHRVNSSWVYGLPELKPTQKAQIKNSSRVANPGCHATGAIMLLKPLIDDGILSEEFSFGFHSLTGYSGGGKPMIQQYESDELQQIQQLGSPRQYGLSQEHKHLPEIVKYSGLKNPPVFTPIVADYFRGMLVNIPLHLNQMAKKMTPNQLADLYGKAYENHRCITVYSSNTISNDGFISADSLKGRDSMEISICGNHNRMTLIARYDNLGKGASGAAIQNMNIMLGLNEYEGLNI